MKNFTKFSIIKDVKSSEDGKKVYFFKASSEREPDRDGDIVLVDGIDTTKFAENPVVLFGHDYRSMSIGKAVDIKKEGEDLIIGVEFAETEEGQKIQYLIDNGYMKAVSIGFIPKEVYSKDGWWGEKYDKLQERYPEWYEKNKDKLLLADTIVWKSELLELSVVPVPANQNALLVMRSKGIDNICSFTVNEHNKTTTVSISVKDIADIKRVVAFNSHPDNIVKDAESSWDKAKSVNSFKDWASSDGSGDKDTIDWIKYRKGFTWYDSENIDNLGSYKYPHHLINDKGDFVTVWRGVASAMAYFMANKEHLPEEDREGVYNHLAKHYKEFDKEPPEYKDYTVSEAIKEFDEDTLVEYLLEVGIEKLLGELKELAKENDDLKVKINDITKEKDELITKLKDIEEKVEDTKQENKDCEIDNVDNTSSSPSEKEVDTEDGGEYIIVDLDEVKNVVDKLLNKLNN